MKIKYSVRQLEEAAQYIYAHNKELVRVWNIKKAEHVERMIIDHIITFAKRYKDTENTSFTGGWMLTFYKEYDYLLVDITVDLSIGYNDYGYIGELNVVEPYGR